MSTERLISRRDCHFRDQVFPYKQKLVTSVLPTYPETGADLPSPTDDHPTEEDDGLPLEIEDIEKKSHNYSREDFGMDGFEDMLDTSSTNSSAAFTSTQHPIQMITPNHRVISAFNTHVAPRFGVPGNLSQALSHPDPGWTECSQDEFKSHLDNKTMCFEKLPA